MSTRGCLVGIVLVVAAALCVSSMVAGPVVVAEKAKPKGKEAEVASIKHEASIDRVRCIFACGRSESWSYKGGANGGKAAVLKMARDWLKTQ